MTTKASEINDSYIVAELGANAELSFVGAGGEGENRITVYSFRDADGYTCRVAATNAIPVWEEQDMGEFAELLESVGVELS